MLRRLSLRLAIPVILAATLLPATLAQSQDSGSVAEAARRAREEKKSLAKSAKVITDDDVKHATPETVSVVGVAPVTAATASQNANASAASASNSSASADTKDQKEPKEVTDLKEQIKQAMGELDLVTREQTLEKDNYYSKPDYANDTAGKAKLDALIQQVTEKQVDLDKLKARLAELLPPQDNNSSNPNPASAPPAPKPQF
jgi:enamine deaminase RidA (YjgF/YER057c/UK114 family)